MEKGSERNPDREALLVKYWSAAAIPIRHLDQELSTICDMKSEYWTNPNKKTDIISTITNPVTLLVLVILVTESALGSLSYAYPLKNTVPIIDMILILCIVFFIIYKKPEWLHL